MTFVFVVFRLLDAKTNQNFLKQVENENKITDEEKPLVGQKKKREKQSEESELRRAISLKSNKVRGIYLSLHPTAT